MSELRKDPIAGHWVIIAQNRANRPMEVADAPQVPPPADLCPFCEGREHETPREIAAYRPPDSAPDQPGWRVRVVPNKYPALEIEGELTHWPQGIYELAQGVGAHEVIIESPRHVRSISELTAENVREVLWIYRDRLLDLKQDQRLLYGMIFKNVGAAAGASLEHIHTQLIAMPIVPISVSQEIDGSYRFFRNRGRCVFCEMCEQELADGRRVVVDTAEFVAFCPFAARSPFETWIVPKRHASHYEMLSPAEAGTLATTIKLVLAKIETALGRPAYNYLIHTAPFDTNSLAHYHWHMEIIPRVTKTAGFEWGTGFYINSVPPEESAAAMRALPVAREDA